MANGKTNSLHKLKDILFGKKARRIYKILAIAFVALAAIGYISALATQSRLEKENAKITFKDINDEFYLDYNSTSQEIKAKISGVSPLAKATILGNTTPFVSILEKYTKLLTYTISDVKEGENKIEIRVDDGKRSAEKTIIIKRQTKEDYDKQELEKAINHAEELLKRAEEDNSEENVSNARVDIDKLPEDKREQFKERIENLESITRERKEKERQEEERRKQEEEQKAQEAVKKAEEEKLEEKRKEREKIERERAATEEQKRQEEVRSQPQQLTQSNDPQPVPAPAPVPVPVPVPVPAPVPVLVPPVNPQPNPIPAQPPAPVNPQPAPAHQPQTNNLPLKAICRDDTVSYQDSPALNTYRGMCSGHKGIRQRLGRIP